MIWKKSPYPETNSEYVCPESITANRIQALETTPNYSRDRLVKITVMEEKKLANGSATVRTQEGGKLQVRWYKLNS